MRRALALLSPYSDELRCPARAAPACATGLTLAPSGLDPHIMLLGMTIPLGSVYDTLVFPGIPRRALLSVVAAFLVAGAISARPGRGWCPSRGWWKPSRDRVALFCSPSGWDLPRNLGMMRRRILQAGGCNSRTDDPATVVFLSIAGFYLPEATSSVRPVPFEHRDRPEGVRRPDGAGPAPTGRSPSGSSCSRTWP